MNTVGTWAISMTDQTYQDLSRLDYWHLPMAEMANAAGAPSSYFDELMANPLPSPFWEAHSVLEGYESITIPVLHWGGWYDNYLGPTIADWRIMAANNAKSGNQHLLIGPGDHENSPDLNHRAGILPVADGDRCGALGRLCCVLRPLSHGPEQRLWQQRRGSLLHAGQRHLARCRCLAAGQHDHDAHLPALCRECQHGCRRRAALMAGTRRRGRLRTGSTMTRQIPTRRPWVWDCWALAGGMGDRQPIEARPDVLVYSSEPLP